MKLIQFFLQIFESNEIYNTDLTFILVFYSVVSKNENFYPFIQPMIVLLMKISMNIYCQEAFKPALLFDIMFELFNNIYENSSIDIIQKISLIQMMFELCKTDIDEKITEMLEIFRKIGNNSIYITNPKVRVIADFIYEEFKGDSDFNDEILEIQILYGLN